MVLLSAGDLDLWDNEADINDIMVKHLCEDLSNQLTYLSRVLLSLSPGIPVILLAAFYIYLVYVLSSFSETKDRPISPMTKSIVFM